MPCLDGGESKAVQEPEYCGGLGASLAFPVSATRRGRQTRPLLLSLVLSHSHSNTF